MMKQPNSRAMSRDIASLLVRLEYRMGEISPGLPYDDETADQLETDERIIREAAELLRSDPSLSVTERHAVQMISERDDDESGR